MSVRREMHTIYAYYENKYKVAWVPNEDFGYEGEPKYYEESPVLIIYFSKSKQYAILANVDVCSLYKKVRRFGKEKWISVTHNHPEGDFTEDGSEVIACIDKLIDFAK
ncbi:hypothetical protein NXH64_10620 [Butyrivibrio fibrisolvens]|uniref:hypothetical protein n=1 Tax=Pseudobutyrivibrio ruminis TaxID=46206 RepID=UPI0004247DA0|nr:hypothetical protein [Pseudobutyrivibrio ruminis]MDC7279951.1 hypothetical protein [Butyrivibrio fibrisolvens]